MAELLICRSTEGESVAEVDLDETTLTLAQIVDLAREQGADLVWAHGGTPTMEGLVPKPGYVHLHAVRPVPGDLLPAVEAQAYGPLLAKAYAGLWGHKWVDPTEPPPDDGSVVLCLTENDAPIGLCRVWPDQRLVDQPGVAAPWRGPRHTQRLLGAACALLGPGPVDVDTWGESPQNLEAYRRLGFAVTEQTTGWELRLRSDRPPTPVGPTERTH
jgi:hypothetical protein